MATDPDPGDREPPPPATEAVLKAAAAIADWCDDKRREAIAAADQQMRTVWWLLGGGVLLLLVLPRLVALIDYTAASLPPDAVKEAAAALREIETNEREMRTELETTQAEYEGLQQEHAAKQDELASVRRELEKMFAGPLSVWKRALPAGTDLAVHVIANLGPEGMFAAGVSEDRASVFRRGTDGAWVPMPPVVDGERLNGATFAMVAHPKGGVLFGGREITPTGRRSPLLVWLKSDGSWSRIQPSFKGPSSGNAFHDLAITKDGGLVVTVGKIVLDAGRWPPSPTRATGNPSSRFGRLIRAARNTPTSTTSRSPPTVR